MKVYYYSDELNDDFANNDIKTKKLPKNYKYFSKNPIRKFFSFIIYHFIVTPIVFLLQKIFYHEKIVGRKKLKKHKKTGFFLFGNHTRAMGDAYCPSLLTFPKKAYIVVNPDAVSIKGIKWLVEDLGAIPVPSDLSEINEFKNYYSAIKKHAEKNHIITIYPEAHIWPFYTDIRPFNDTSFRFPVITKKPVFTFTSTYEKRKFGKGVKVTVYVDGPFFTDETLSVKDQTTNLRDVCYDTMKERSKLSTYSKNIFIKKEQ